MSEPPPPQTRGLALDPDNPWPGLHSFEEGARDYFHGREAEAADLLGRVVEAPVTVLFGKSGLGKTSLLKAGLFPRLRERGFLPVYLRLDLRRDAPEPIDQMGRALRDELERGGVDAPPMGGEERLWDYLHRAGLELWSPRNRLLTPVFVLDQFEEIYTLGPSLGRALEAFRIELGDLAENRIPAALAARLEKDEAAAAGLDLRRMPYKVILSLREDFLPELETDRRVIPALGRVRVRLLAMHSEQALEAVHGAAPHLLDERTARRIVRFVAAEQQESLKPGDSLIPFTMQEAAGEIEPALLSLFCRGLNEERKRQGKEHIDRGLIESVKQGIVDDYYRACLEGLPDRVGRFIETELITGKGFRSSFARDDAVPARLSEEDLDRLIHARLIRLEEHYGTQRIELTHDLLTKAVRGHRDARQAEERLREHEERERRLRMESQARSAQRFRAISGLLAVALVAALFMTGLAVYQGRQANSKSLAFTSLDLLRRGDAEASLSQAILALEGAETTQAREALIDALGAAVVRKRWEIPLSRVSAVAVSPDGSQVGATAAGGAGVWSVATGQRQASVCLPEAVALHWTPPDGERLLLGLGEGRVVSWDVTPGHSDFDRLTTLFEGADAGLLDFDLRGDGQELAVVTLAGGLVRLDLTAQDPAEARFTLDSGVLLPDEVIWRAAYGPNGQRLAIGNSDGRIAQIDVETGRVICRSGAPGVDVLRLGFSGSPLGLMGAATRDFNVRSWPDGGCEDPRVFAHSGVVWDLAYTPDGDYLVTVSDEGVLRLWDPATGDELHSRTVPDDRLVRIAAVARASTSSGDGGDRIRIVTAGVSRTDADQGSLTLWDIAPRAERDALYASGEPLAVRLSAEKLLGRARELELEPLLLEEQALPPCQEQGL